MSRFTMNKKFWGILFLGLALRIGYVFSLPASPHYPDEKHYLISSQHLYEGRGYLNEDGFPTAYHPIGYPLFLTLLRTLGLDTILAFRLIQAMLSALIIRLVYCYTCTLVHKTAGYWAALLVAIYPYFIYATGTILTPVLISLVLLAACWFLYRGADKKSLTFLSLSGLGWSLAIFIQPAVTVLLGAAILWLLLHQRLEKAFLLKALMLMILMVALANLPWLYRNYRVLGVFSFGTNMGINLWLGNNPNAQIGAGSTEIDTTSAIWQKTQQATSEVERDRTFKRAAVDFIRQNPMKSIKHYLLKALYLWRLDTSPTTSASLTSKLQLLNVISIISFAPVLILAIVSFVIATGDVKKHLWLWFYLCLANTLFYALFMVKVRFRLPLDHLLIMAAAIQLAALFDRIKRFLRFPGRRPESMRNG